MLKETRFEISDSTRQYIYVLKLLIQYLTLVITYLFHMQIKTCVKKSGQIQPHSKQLRLGLIRFDLLG